MPVLSGLGDLSRLQPEVFCLQALLRDSTKERVTEEKEIA